jgi:hypothetical protein
VVHLVALPATVQIVNGRAAAGAAAQTIVAAATATARMTFIRWRLMLRISHQ